MCVFPFGVSNAPEEFQREKTSMFSDIPELYFDDILIATETEKEHDAALNKV